MVISTLVYSTIFIVTSVLTELSVKMKDSDKFSKSHYLFVVISLCSVPAFFSSIRYGIGTDYFNYVEIFEFINTGRYVRTEFGYYALNFIVGNLGGNVHLVFFIVSFLTVLFVYLYLYNYKDSIDVGLGMLVFLLIFYNMSFNIVRQSLAISIALYAYIYIEKKNVWLYLIISFLAVSIHTSAIIIIPMYFIYNYLTKESVYYQALIYFIIILCILNYQTIIEFISLNVLQDPYYLFYATKGPIDFGVGIFLIFAPHIVIGALFYKDLIKISKNFAIYFFFLNIGFLLRSIVYLGIPHLNRIGDFFYVVVVWLVPFYFRFFENSNKYNYIRYILVLYLVIMWFIGYIISGGSETVPYKTIFSI